MDIARNLMTAPAGDAPGRPDEETGGRLPANLNAIDWPALRSRLFAAHDMLGASGSEARGSRLRLRGSFAGGTATALHAYDEVLRTVNRDVSSNSKPVGRKVSPIAAVNGSGERG